MVEAVAKGYDMKDFRSWTTAGDGTSRLMPMPLNPTLAIGEARAALA
jgi:hypothetical protein